MNNLKINGEFNSAVVFCKSKIYNALDQIKDICNDYHYKDSKIVVMPDYHAGTGCVIGLTMKFSNPVNPELVGVDIGCGVRVSKIKNVAQFAELDNVIRNHNYITQTCKELQESITQELDLLKCDISERKNYILNQVGTLGSGNHFIEIDAGQNGYYLTVHSGSRFLGVLVANFYAQKFKNDERGWFDDYLHDLKIAQKYAKINREIISKGLCETLGMQVTDSFESVHNYIDLEKSILRKGAISADLNQNVIIPLNMKDGSIIGTGKGNPDWNFSAPHGAGRILSRSEAKKNLNINDFINDMQGIYTSCINAKTLDESSFAYKTPDQILDVISPTVEIKEIIKPVYNFKN